MTYFIPTVTFLCTISKTHHCYLWINFE